MDKDFIKVEDVEFRYKAHVGDIDNPPALSGMNVEIKDGEFVVVLGRNGSGKSTFARLLNALILPTRGAVYIKNYSTSEEGHLWNIRQTVGMVFQNPDNQIIATSVEEDVAFGPENLGISTDEIIERVNKALCDVGMLEYCKAAPHNLSGGQKQRIAIAGVLAMKPKCIILDEATSMLDPIGRKEVMSVLNRLNKEENITVIHITHHMEEAVPADRVIVIHEGRMVMDGKPKEVFSKVEEIKSVGLDVPQVAELFHELTKEGYDLPENILSVDDAIEYFKSII